MKTFTLRQGSLICVCVIVSSLSSYGVVAIGSPKDTVAAVDFEISGDWPAYNRSFDGSRFSPLDQISKTNVTHLKEVCRFNVGVSAPFEAGPVVIDGLMYFTMKGDTIALDATNCKVRWRATYKPTEVGRWLVNRGVAYLNGRIFRGTGDGRLLAYDAVTGRLLWADVVGDSSRGEFISSAPIAWNGMVYIGTTGSEWGIRGKMLAFDAITGREVWRFNLIPAENDLNAETWKSAAAAEIGGGGTWSSYALDQEKAEIFIPVGNPAPDFIRAPREGDNLYTDSVVVLDARTGALKWWYQLIAGDDHDLDLAASPLLFRNSQQRQMLAAAGKDGYLHVVDRNSHQRVYRVATTTHEAATEGVPPTTQGIHICPGSLGGTEWNGPAFSSSLNLIYVPSIDWCATLKSDSNDKYVAGEIYYGGKDPKMDASSSGWITAFDSDTGKVAWEFHSPTPVVAALTPTAGGLLFAGDLRGQLYAFDSATGAILYQRDTGGGIAGGIVTYAVSGTQYVATTSGNASRVSWFGTLGEPSIIVMALASGIANAGPSGKALYAQHCSICHGLDRNGDVARVGQTGPGLLGLSSRLGLQATVEQIKHPKGAMPAFYPQVLNQRQVEEIAGFLLSK